MQTGVLGFLPLLMVKSPHYDDNFSKQRRRCTVYVSLDLCHLC